MSKTNETLVLEIQQGKDCKKNLEILYLQNKTLIFEICKRLNYNGLLEDEDIAQEAYLGLHKAVELYDQDKGILFMSYAGYWIKQYLQRYLENNSTCVRIPNQKRQDIFKYNRFMSAYLAQFGKEPSKTEIYTALHFDRAKIEGLKRASIMTNLPSLDAPISGQNEINLLDIVKGSMAAEQIIDKKEELREIKEVVNKTVEELPEDEQKVIHARYWQKKSIKNVSAESEMTIGKVRTIEARALRQLRNKRQIQRIGKDYGYIRSMGMHCIGITNFNRTWTSSTEYAALKLLPRNF